MKKILSLICAAAIAMSMMAVTVSAAVTKPTITTECVDLSAKDTDKYHYVGVKVMVEIPETLAEYVEDDSDDDIVYSGKLISQIQLRFDLGEGYAFNKSATTTMTGCTPSKYGDNGVTLLYYPGNDPFSWYCGDSKFELATVAFRINKETYSSLDARNITAGTTSSDLNIQIREYSGVGDRVSTPTSYEGSSAISFVGGNVPAFTTVVTPSLTATTLKAWDTGLGLLVIAKVDGTYTTKGINLTKDGAPYVLAAPSKYAGMGPDFPATKDATDDGYYGVYIRNAAAGSYVAKAYADTTYDAGITVTVAE